MLLNHEWVNNEIREEIKKFLETNENEHGRTQNLRDTRREPEREVISNKGLPKKDGNISNKQPNTTFTRTTGTTTNKAQSE